MNNMTWYDTLNKPGITPPSWVFTPAWAILYIMIAISFIFFIRSDNTKDKRLALTLFIIQMILNFAWSPIFFGMQNISFALIVILLLLITLLMTIITFYKHSKTASLLLIPYFLWVCFATYLNFGFWAMN